MLSLATLFTTLAALGSANGAAINKRAARSIKAADITNSGFSFPLESNVQPFTVDTAGYYRLFLRGGGGGLGGADRSSAGGKGAVVQGAYVLLPGQTYLAVVGQKGSNGVGTPEISAGGGGGGSFVYSTDNTVLVAAGGGGGNSFDGSQIGRDALSSAATSGNATGGTANPGAGGGGAGFGTADETGQTGDGADTGRQQGAKGGKTKNTWAGGAVDSRQIGAQGKGGFGGGGGGGKYSGGGGGGYTGGMGGPVPGNLNRPNSPGSGGTSLVLAENYNGFVPRETQYLAATNTVNGQVAIRYLPYYAGPFTSA